MGWTVNPWLGEFESHTRSQIITSNLECINNIQRLEVICQFQVNELRSGEILLSKEW